MQAISTFPNSHIFCSADSEDFIADLPLPAGMDANVEEK